MINLLELYKNPISTIYNPIVLPNYSILIEQKIIYPWSDKNIRTFVFVGRLAKVKRVDLLLQAFKQVQQKQLCRLLIVGDGTEKAFILDFIRKEDETMSKAEKILLIRMFREYALATKGKSFFRFSRESVEYYRENYNLDLKILDDELEIQNRESQGDVIYSVELKLWKLFSPNSLQVANLLMQDTSQDMEDYILKIINERLIE